MHHTWLILCVIFCEVIAEHTLYSQNNPLGSLLNKGPEQTACANPTASIPKNGWKLQPLAQFTIEARVLSKAAYTKGFSASLAIYDLALGWGAMADPALLEKFSITQSDRFYQWRYWSKIPLNDGEIKSHSANMHIIPADDAVLQKLRLLQTGALIRIEGCLVEATHPRALKPWRSSLSRDDEGEGACEVLYALSLIELPPEPKGQK